MHKETYKSPTQLQSQCYFEREHVQQLRAVLNRLGTPIEADRHHLSRPVQHLIGTLEKTQGCLQSDFSSVPKEAVEILLSMLEFSPQKRASAAETLKHSVFEPFRDQEKEVSCRSLTLDQAIEPLLESRVLPR